MNNNSMISVMFEEIKSLIASIDKKIDERIGIKGSSVSNIPLQNPDEEGEPSPLELSIRQIPLYLSGIQKRLNQISETDLNSEKHVLSHIIKKYEKTTIVLYSDSFIYERIIRTNR